MVEPNVWQWTKKTIKTHWKPVTLIALAALIMAGASGAFPIVWQELIDNAVAGTVSYWLIALFAVLLCVQLPPIVHFPRARFLNRYAFESRYQMLRHVLRLSIPFHKERESTKVLLEAKKGISAGTTLLRIFLQGDILADVPVAVFAWFYVLRHSATAAMVLLVFLLVFFGLSYWLGSKITAVDEKSNELDNDISARQREVLQHIEAVKLCRAEKQEENWYLTQGSKALEMDHEQTKYNVWFEFMVHTAYNLPFAIALVLFLPSVAGGTLTVGTLIALQMFSMRVVGPAGFLGRMLQEILVNAAKLKPALRLLQQKPTIVEAQNPVEMQPLRHEIKIQDVSFRYPDAEKQVLRNISLTFRAGEKVAIVGKTGSGKTTAARLLVRFYDPDYGIITMDGTDLRQISFDSLYRQICYVTQEVPVFSGTIGENVSYGLSDVDNNHLADAVNYASADFVFRKEHGLATKVGELGEKLSGGERQRLALARIFLRKPSVLILDEATSALDRMTEREVQVAFDQLLTMNGGTTMVVIAHRISTVKNADRILVLHGGSVLDTGTHTELLDRCPLYQELCEGMAS